MSIVRIVLAVLATAFGLLLALPLLVAGLPFWAIAVTTRALARVLEPRSRPSSDFIEFDPAFGWKPKANVDAYHLGDEDMFRVTTDHQGWRGRTSISESEIVVFGDSFAWGAGVDDGRFFAGLVPGVRVKAVGTLGYNMVQQLLWMQRLAPELAGKLVVWFVYFGNDLFENLMPHMQGYRMPFLRQVNGSGEWEVERSHLRRAKWPGSTRSGSIYYRKLAEYCAPGPRSTRGYAACEFLLRQGRDVCRHAGARLVVLTIPEKTQLSRDGIGFLLRHGGDPATLDPDLPDRRIGAICVNLEIPFVAGKAHLNLGHYRERDCHWNEGGHRKVAGILAGISAGILLDSRR